MNSRCDDEYMEIVGRLRSRKCINVRWYDYYNMSWDQSEALSKIVRINTRLGMDRHLKLERVQLLLDRHSQLWC